MILKRILAVLLICFVAACLFPAITPPAHAQDDIMQKKGLGGLFSGKSNYSSDPRAPTRFQMWAGIGSIAVMVIVVKFL